MNKKALLLSSMLAGVGLLLISCGGGGSPEDLPKVFVNALMKGNTKVLDKITTGSISKEATAGLDQFKDFKVKISKFKVTDKKDIGENKKNIRVEYVSEVKAKKGKGFAMKVKADMIFHLVKEEKRWLIEDVTVGSPPQKVE